VWRRTPREKACPRGWRAEGGPRYGAVPPNVARRDGLLGYTQPRGLKNFVAFTILSFHFALDLVHNRSLSYYPQLVRGAAAV
jgi:hypothetical protein